VKRLGGVLVVAGVALVTVVGFLWSTAPRSTRLAAGSRLPAVDLPFAVNDSRSRLSTIRGEPLLLVFVETSSPGGRAFASSLEKLHRRYLRRGLQLVAIALDENRDALRKVLAEDAITYMVLHDPGARATRSTIGSSQPGDAYLVGADGVVDTAFASGGGADWKDLRIQFAIERLLPKGR
jgi:peroxiredoxin